MDQPRECEHTRFWASGVSEQYSMRMPRRSAAEQAARVNRALLFKLHSSLSAQTFNIASFPSIVITVISIPDPIRCHPNSRL